MSQTYGTPLIVGPLLKDISHGINKALCDLLGPNFINSFPKHHRCPKELIAPHVCQSIEAFCKWYRNGGPIIQDCVATSVEGMEINVNGVIGTRGHIGQCCNVPVSIYDCISLRKIALKMFCYGYIFYLNIFVTFSLNQFLMVLMLLMLLMVKLEMVYWVVRFWALDWLVI